MYLKAIGIVLVLFSTTSIGFVLSRRLGVRVGNLEAILNGFQFLGAEIGYLKTPITEAFYKAVQSTTEENFFSDVLFEQKKEGAVIAGSYESALLKNYKKYDLNQKDLKILLEFKNNLGMHDLQNQLKMIDYIKNGLQIQIEEGRKNEQKYGKLYKSLGFLSGAFIVILFV